MNWTKRWCFLANLSKTTRGIPSSGGSVHNIASNRHSKHKYGIVDAHCMQPCRMNISETSSLWRHKLVRCRTERGSLWSREGTTCISRQFAHGAEDGDGLNRNFFAQLWIAERKIRKSKEKRRQKIVGHKKLGDYHPFERYSSGAAVRQENLHGQGEKVVQQPPVSQSIDGNLKPGSLEAKVATLLSRSNLLITRDIEWKNLVLGLEQENRYAIVDVCHPELPAGFIREKSNIIARQLLRLRRPFVASITDAMHNELFKVRRPFWWITSSIYAEIDGKEIGVVHRRWHLWKRIYDLYLGNKQFAVVENPGFWNWTFTLKDNHGKVLAEVDRNWRGFGFELFTDAGQYVIRFGTADPSSKTGLAEEVQELNVACPLTLSERAVAVALAISLDNDYFSRHGGWGLPFFVVDE